MAKKYREKQKNQKKESKIVKHDYSRLFAGGCWLGCLPCSVVAVVVAINCTACSDDDSRLETRLGTTTTDWLALSSYFTEPTCLLVLGIYNLMSGFLNL